MAEKSGCHCRNRPQKLKPDKTGTGARYEGIACHTLARMASKEQKEGIARVFDTLAASRIIAAVVGFSGHSIITVAQIVALCVLAPYCSPWPGI